MSDQLTSQSRSNESGITRRTALRGAAWSASAVTVVVAAPAQAATSKPATASTISIRRSKDDKNRQLVIWDFTITAGSAPLNGLNATFTSISDVTALEVTTGGVAWSGTGNSLRTYGTLSAGATLTATAVFTRSSNGTGTATMTVKVAGSTAAVLTLPANYS